MQKLKLFFRYLIYLIRSTNAHGVHSPFVFDLVTNVIYSKKHFYSFNKINRIRKELNENETTISIRDFGAGSLYSNSSIKKINQIAQQSAKSEKQGELLFRLVNKFAPQTILELGTSLGVSGMYLASACSKSQMITIEASVEIAQIAKKIFEEMHLDNVTLLQGTFENKLTEAIQKLKILHFVFFDGNHRKKPTLAYFNECLNQSVNESVFVFDDIHWSKEMEEAWKEIKNHPKVTLTVDLFFMGIIFFKMEQVKEHFIIRY